MRRMLTCTQKEAQESKTGGLADAAAAANSSSNLSLGPKGIEYQFLAWPGSAISSS